MFVGKMLRNSSLRIVQHARAGRIFLHQAYRNESTTHPGRDVPASSGIIPALSQLRQVRLIASISHRLLQLNPPCAGWNSRIRR